MEASSEFSADEFNVNTTTNHFTIDDLLDFPQEDNKPMADGLFIEPVDSSIITTIESCNSSISGGETTPFKGNLSARSSTDVQFLGGELCVPYDDLAELEWLSNFVEESFSSDDMHNLHFIPTTNKPPSSITTTTTTKVSDDKNNLNSLPIFPSEVSVPGKARSKRSRAAPCDWSSRLLRLSPTTSSTEKTNLLNVSNINPLIIASNNHIKQAKKRREITDTPGRKCLHCASEKTPQWRSGPLGPKTLCNACGVRYKSGRLVAEYRPASSPTFVSAKHSNSHRKVMELRRQKEMYIVQSHETARQLISQNEIFAISSGGDDYLIDQPHQINAHDFSHMI